MTLDYGTVEWHAEDMFPLEDAIRGSITFRATASALYDPSEEITIFPQPVVAHINSDGVLVTDNNGSFTEGVELLATNDPDVAPVGLWSWSVEFDNLRNAEGVKVSAETFWFLVPIGATIDLTTVIHIDPDSLDPDSNVVSGVVFPWFTPEQFGAVGNGVDDDSDALEQATNAAKAVDGSVLLGAKTYGISRLIQFVGINRAADLIGIGQSGSVIKALHADAGLAWGEGAFGPGWTGQTLYGRPSVSQSWKFDGNLISTKGVVIGATVGFVTWNNIWVTKCNGNGLQLFGVQNSVFNVCNSDGNAGHGWVIDYGAANLSFITCQASSNDGYDVCIRQSGGLGWGTSSQPQFLNLQNFQTEQSGSPFFDDTGLGGICIETGTFITIDRCTLSNTRAGTVQGSLVLKPSPWIGGATGWITYRDSYTQSIYLDANVAGAATSMGGGNEPLFLEGLCTMVNIINGSTGYIIDNCQKAGACTYTTEGTGAAAYLLHARKAKTANDPMHVWYNSAGLGLAQITKEGNIIARNSQTEQVFIGDVSGIATLNLGGDASILRSAAGEIFTNKIIAATPTDAGIPLKARGHSASQTGNLIQAEASGGVPVWSVDKDGLPKWEDASNIQTTVGAAGGASALPASPTKYLKVKGSDGTVYVIPAFAVS